MTRDGGARPAGNRPGTDPSVDPYILVPADLIAYVADHKISPTALALYVVLLSHHNRKRGDDYVWPRRESMARALGLSRPQSVDKYLTELRAAGLIITESSHKQPGMRTSSSRHKLLLVVRAMRQSAQPYAPERTASYAPEEAAGYAPERTRTRGSELDESELDEMNSAVYTAPRASRGSPNDFLDPWAR